MPLIRSVVLCLLCCLAWGAHAQGIEPAPDWKTADSAHFRVTYRGVSSFSVQ